VKVIHHRRHHHPATGRYYNAKSASTARNLQNSLLSLYRPHHPLYSLQKLMNTAAAA
jgi:hypothetical protein